MRVKGHVQEQKLNEFVHSQVTAQFLGFCTLTIGATSSTLKNVSNKNNSAFLSLYWKKTSTNLAISSFRIIV